MLRLPESLKAWPGPDFKATLKTEVERFAAQQLPLQQGLTQGSYVSDDGFQLSILSSTEQDGVIFTNAGVFFTGLLPGCSCADDPTPMNTYPEYCEITIRIDLRTAATNITLQD